MNKINKKLIVLLVRIKLSARNVTNFVLACVIVGAARVQLKE